LIETRQYNAPNRARQAAATRGKVAAAASELFAENGFDKTTITQVAARAGVAVPTVYALFSSKAGIVQEILSEARFGPSYKAAVARARGERSPVDRLKRTAAIARGVYDGERRLLDLWRGAEMLSPDLAAVVLDAEHRRRDLQAPTIDLLIERGALKRGLKREDARDLLWSLTARELYRLLVVNRGWSGRKYERHVGNLLAQALLEEPGD
jgi:AcrR family transcriptional regulator